MIRRKRVGDREKMLQGVRTSRAQQTARWTGRQTRKHPPLTPVLLLFPSSKIESKVLIDP